MTDRHGWRPISEAPRDGTVVDLWAAGKRCADCYWEDYGDPDISDAHWRQMYSEVVGPSFELDHSPTHWQPIPEPPTASDDWGKPLCCR